MSTKRKCTSFLSGPSVISAKRNRVDVPEIFSCAQFQWENIESISLNGSIDSTDEINYSHTFLNKDASSLPIGDTWDNLHVKLPCSSHNISEENGKVIPIWEIIKEALSSPLKSTNDFTQAVYSYNSKYSQVWNFEHLKSALQIQPSFLRLLPKIAQLALKLPELITRPIPLLHSGEEGSITLSQLQISCLLANAFYSTFPLRNSKTKKSEYANFPCINFGYFLSKWFRNRSVSTVQKILSILHYFDCVLSDDFSGDGVVTFTRRCNKNPSSFASSEVKFNSIAFGVSSTCLIEDAHPDTIQMDFADPFLGGQILRGGCVQEEILFCIRPELLAGMLFMEAMGSNETIIVEGAQRFSRYKGYGKTFQWCGGFDEVKDANNSRTTNGHWKGVIVAIDAVHYKQSASQFTSECIQRELNKAYCGFSDNFAPYRQLPNVVVSGNWGCGVFKGDKELKCLIQLMACARAGKSLAYCTFSNDDFGTRALGIFKILCDTSCSVGQLWEILTKISRSQNTKPSVFKFVSQQLKGPK